MVDLIQIYGHGDFINVRMVNRSNGTIFAMTLIDKLSEKAKLRVTGGRKVTGPYSWMAELPGRKYSNTGLRGGDPVFLAGLIA